jgi:hypothetical protein
VSLGAGKFHFNPLLVLIAMDWTKTLKDSPRKILFQLRAAFVVLWRRSTKDGTIEFGVLAGLN